MNYNELQRANELLNEIKEIEIKLRVLEHPFNYAIISINDYKLYFNDKYKQKFVDILKEIRDDMVKELNELGVTEVDDI